MPSFRNLAQPEGHDLFRWQCIYGDIFEEDISTCGRNDPAGGRVAAAVPKPIRLEGSLETPGSLALLAFDTAEGAEAWHADPELATIHDLRRSGAEVSIFVLKQGA